MIKVKICEDRIYIYIHIEVRIQMEILENLREWMNGSSRAFSNVALPLLEFQKVG